MNKAAKILLLTSSLALSGALAQPNPAPQTPPAQPAQRSMKAPWGHLGNLYLAAAQFLGVTPGELALLSGGSKTLGQVASELGKTPAALEAALVTARNQAIDQAVQAGRLTAQEASNLKASSPAVAKALVAQPVQLRLGLRDGWEGPRGRGR
ncbi:MULTISPECIES: hypothetical protein [unclassified Meiothermus]|uniref:hypothetical protein n=1 Tax=unclassified Meiothermus TaxID=370471 RepID=UPI000D7CF29A|nr:MULTISPECIES: hypothetical protein [unclassified Meiothermus]PZA05817.1 hypothetical protein DNA98_16805 [Meiothermus sp. Pnk-1]RYM29953.1 hypothetical protein EWH23_15800 [Meiothermus sp. PNK-Is4]